MHCLPKLWDSLTQSPPTTNFPPYYRSCLYRLISSNTSEHSVAANILAMRMVSTLLIKVIEEKPVSARRTVRGQAREVFRIRGQRLASLFMILASEAMPYPSRRVAQHSDDAFQLRVPSAQ